MRFKHFLRHLTLSQKVQSENVEECQEDKKCSGKNNANISGSLTVKEILDAEMHIVGPKSPRCGGPTPLTPRPRCTLQSTFKQHSSRRTC